jgi:hypothetical protein
MASPTSDASQVKWPPIAISIVALVLGALGQWPYGFFVLLRFVVCATAIYLGFCAKEIRRPFWLVTMWGIALLFNPIVPVHMNRSDWQVLDFLIAILLMLSYRMADIEIQG